MGAVLNDSCWGDSAGCCKGPWLAGISNLSMINIRSKLRPCPVFCPPSSSHRTHWRKCSRWGKLYILSTSVFPKIQSLQASVSTTINSDYRSKKHIHSALVTHKQMRHHYRYGLQQGPGQRSVGRVLISILSANSVPATPQLGPLPHPPSLSQNLLLELWYFNKYWKSDCCSASQLSFQHLLFFQVLIDSKRSLFRSILHC